MRILAVTVALLAGASLATPALAQRGSHHGGGGSGGSGGSWHGSAGSPGGTSTPPSGVWSPGPVWHNSPPPTVSPNPPHFDPPAPPSHRPHGWVSPNPPYVPGPGPNGGGHGGPSTSNWGGGYRSPVFHNGTGGTARHGGNRWGGAVNGRWHAGWKAPGGWHGYREPHRGWTLPRYWIAPSFFIADYWSWGLSAPPQGHHWSRYYDDAVLIDDGGRIWDSRQGIDWDGGAYADGYGDDGYGGYGAYDAGASSYSYSSSYANAAPGCGAVYPAPPPGYGPAQGCSTYSVGGNAPPVVYAPPAEQTQPYPSGYGGYGYGASYYYGAPATTTVVIQSAPVVTTTIVEEVIEEQVVTTYRPAVRKKRSYRPRRSCACVCTTVCR